MKVSIITVCYNAAATVEETIQSVVGQDYSNVEYIIVDGGSKDNTLSILEKYKQHFSVFISEKDNGLFDALNKGVKKATGDIVGILHADDLFANSRIISTMVKSMTESGADAFYSDLVYVDKYQTNKVKRYWKSGKYKPGSFRYGWMPPHPTFFVKREVYDKFGLFDTRLRSAADYELMLRFIHIHWISLVYFPQVTVKMRSGGNSNASIKSRLTGNREDRESWKLNKISPNPLFFILKPLRKIPQYLIAGFKAI